MPVSHATVDGRAQGADASSRCSRRWCRSSSRSAPRSCSGAGRRSCSPDAMTVGSLTVFLAYLAQVLQAGAGPREDDQHDRADGGGARARSRRSSTPTRSSRSGPTRATRARSRARSTFEHVAFAYDPEGPGAARTSTSQSRPASSSGIVGPTGGGKSTVVSLIPRFYDPDAGRVLIDGVDVRDYTLQGLRDQIGFVLQDTVLFRGTVRDNIAYGRPDATDDADRRRPRSSPTRTSSSRRMPNGYDTMVGERGLTLSGGQRQRIGIARAIIRNAPILILDEPTAALDTESEKLVMEALERLMKGRTVDHDRAPPEHDPRRRQDHRPQGRRGRRGRHARRARGARTASTPSCYRIQVGAGRDRRRAPRQ